MKLRNLNVMQIADWCETLFTHYVAVNLQMPLLDVTGSVHKTAYTVAGGCLLLLFEVR